MFANYLNDITIHKFLGGGTVNISFHKDINFLIGLNGTGKTTLINIVRSALFCDSRALFAAPFEKLQMRFTHISGRGKPILTVIKNIEESSIVYEIKEHTRAPSYVAEVNVDNLYARHRAHFFPTLWESSNESDVERIREHLPRVTWLPLQRGALQSGPLPDGDPTNPVDRKIKQIVFDTTKYLSALDTLYSTKLENFQHNYFLSLINATFSKVEDAYKYNLKEEQEGIDQIFQEFFKKSSYYKKALKSHFERTEKSLESYRTDKRLYFNDFIAISDTVRLHKLVENWRALQAEKREIYGPKNLFIKIINDLLVNKHFSFDERNQPRFSRDRSSIALEELSSGEKQLYIMLGSLVLQEGQPFIYLADEPELSLHIEWQRALVSHLKALNPRSQIIFATHSPDVVGPFADKVFSMETLLRD